MQNCSGWQEFFSRSLCRGDRYQADKENYERECSEHKHLLCSSAERFAGTVQPGGALRRAMFYTFPAHEKQIDLERVCELHRELRGEWNCSSQAEAVLKQTADEVAPQEFVRVPQRIHLQVNRCPRQVHSLSQLQELGNQENIPWPPVIIAGINPRSRPFKPLACCRPRRSGC